MSWYPSQDTNIHVFEEVRGRRDRAPHYVALHQIRRPAGESGDPRQVQLLSTTLSHLDATSADARHEGDATESC